MKDIIDTLKENKILQNGFEELFTTFVEMCYTYKNTAENPYNAVQKIDLKTKYPSTKEFLTCMLELIYTGYGYCFSEFKFCSKFKLAMCIKEAKTDEEIGELILAGELINYFAEDDRQSIYHLISLIGFEIKLINKLVPDGSTFC